jgi:hypothetical protein
MVTKNWLTIAFIGGFITDLILLNRIDDLFDNLILLAYVVLATASLLLFYVGVAERAGMTVSRLLVRYIPILMQYAFGGLLSGMLIFYGRSGDLIASAPFYLIIVAVVLGNELVEKRSETLLYNLTLYFIGVLSYVILVVPVALGQVGDGIFILSGLLGLLIMCIVLQLLRLIIPKFFTLNIRGIIFVVVGVLGTMNALYFFRIIPPIPLSLTELDIVESVVREGTDYVVRDEIQPWYRQLPLVREEIHPDGSGIACFARVYAPFRLRTQVYHRWEFRNASGDWEEAFRLGYDITGEATGGYRGYTRLNQATPGVWRCGVENARGQVLGRATVRVSADPTGRPTVTRIE